MSREAPIRRRGRGRRRRRRLPQLIRSICDVIDDDRCPYYCRRLRRIHLQFVAHTTAMIIHLIYLPIHHSSFQSHLDLYIRVCARARACAPCSLTYHHIRTFASVERCTAANEKSNTWAVFMSNRRWVRLKFNIYSTV